MILSNTLSALYSSLRGKRGGIDLIPGVAATLSALPRFSLDAANCLGLRVEAFHSYPGVARDPLADGIGRPMRPHGGVGFNGEASGFAVNGNTERLPFVESCLFDAPVRSCHRAGATGGST